MNDIKAQLATYPRTITWSEEDQCYIGRCPDLFYGGCHGMDQTAVADELNVIMLDVAQSIIAKGDPLPPPSKQQPRLGNALAARRRTLLNQRQFARRIGVGIGTLRNWEQGRKTPKGPTAILLHLIEKEPDILRRIDPE